MKECIHVCLMFVCVCVCVCVPLSIIKGRQKANFTLIVQAQLQDVTGIFSSRKWCTLYKPGREMLCSSPIKLFECVLEELYK